MRESAKIQIIKMFIENSNINKDCFYTFDYVESGKLEISFYYNETSTIAYCKSNMEDLQRTIELLGGKVYFDYESNTIAPIFEVEL